MKNASVASTVVPIIIPLTATPDRGGARNLNCCLPELLLSAMLHSTVTCRECARMQNKPQSEQCNPVEECRVAGSQSKRLG